MKLNEEIVCKDGFTMSVQANNGAYCSPRIDGAPRYTHAEIGFPSHPEPLLLEWADDESHPTGTVYGYVPADRISLGCVKHGGIVSGELPAGIPAIKADDASR